MMLLCCAVLRWLQAFCPVVFGQLNWCGAVDLAAGAAGGSTVLCLLGFYSVFKLCMCC
jgi:hypothetical protein